MKGPLDQCPFPVEDTRGSAQGWWTSKRRVSQICKKIIPKNGLRIEMYVLRERALHVWKNTWMEKVQRSHLKRKIKTLRQRDDPNFTAVKLQKVCHLSHIPTKTIHRRKKETGYQYLNTRE